MTSASSRILRVMNIPMMIRVMLFLLLLGLPAYGQNILVGKGREFEPKTLSLPYAFYNKSFGVAVGYVYGYAGYPQK